MSTLADAAVAALTPHLGGPVAAHVSNNALCCVDPESPCSTDARAAFLESLRNLSRFPNVPHLSEEECTRLANTAVAAIELAMVQRRG